MITYDALLIFLLFLKSINEFGFWFPTYFKIAYGRLPNTKLDPYSNARAFLGQGKITLTITKLIAVERKLMDGTKRFQGDSLADQLSGQFGLVDRLYELELNEQYHPEFVELIVGILLRTKNYVERRLNRAEVYEEITGREYGRAIDRTTRDVEHCDACVAYKIGEFIFTEIYKALAREKRKTVGPFGIVLTKNLMASFALNTIFTVAIIYMLVSSKKRAILGILSHL